MPAQGEREVLGSEVEERLLAALSGACGIVLTSGQLRNLPDAVREAARARGVSIGVFAELVDAGDEPALEALVERAVVGETCFLRHADQLRALAGLLPALAPGGAPLELWSAGCASGEEAFTLAMLLREAGRAGDRVLGTDVSEPALAQARAGRYGHWSLRRLDPQRRRRWFREVGDELEVHPELRAMVELRAHNLVRDPTPASFDVVVCRNVLVYFGPDTAAEVASRLLASVRPGGLLLLGPVELPLAASLPAEWVDRGGATLLRRPGGAPLPAIATSTETANATPNRAPTQASASTAALTPATLGPLFLAARHHFRVGALSDAERLARAAVEGEKGPEPWLLLAQLAEARGELEVALSAARSALELEPALPVGLAALAALLDRRGQPALAGLARADAERRLAGVPDEALLRGVEPVPAGALRRALSAPADDA